MITVLFADLVDSTGLGERLDPERAREVLGAFFDAATEELQALRGRPEKFIGDAVMAVFGVPVVHEDDALRAVRAGLAIRGRLRRLGSALGLAEPLRVRVGIEVTDPLQPYLFEVGPGNYSVYAVHYEDGKKLVSDRVEVQALPAENKNEVPAVDLLVKP
jgi:hypothetical protein